MTSFPVHTADSAPEKSKEVLKNIQAKLGLVPNVLGEIAESPAFLRAYSDISAALGWSQFSPVEREVIQVTTSLLNNSSYCIAAHVTLAEKSGVPRSVMEELRHERPLKEPRLESLRQFTRSLLKKLGRPDEQDLADFYKAGYSQAQALEVILNITFRMMTNYVNHMAATPLDKAFEPNRVDSKKPDGRKASHAA